MTATPQTAPSAPPSAPVNGVIGGQYQPLFQVAFTHSYYNAAPGEACPDLAVTPTPDCAKLMRMLGMAFKDRGTGFTILIDQTLGARAGAYIAGRLQAGVGQANSGLTRLSFLLTPTRSGFIGVTNLPITLNPSLQNLHASNLDAASDGVITLDGAKPATASEPAAPPTLFPVRGATVTIPAPEGAKVTLTDFTGAAVVCPVTRTSAATTFRLTGAAYGLYTVTTTPASGAPTSLSFVYTSGPPAPLAVLDLVLAQAPGGPGAASAFPFSATAAGPAPSVGPSASGGVPPITVTGPNPVFLSLPFTARETFWEYYVVAQDRVGGRGGAFSDLKITGKGATFTRAADVLPNGDPATRFTSGKPLPLQQNSKLTFALSGQRRGADGARDPISIARLPTAPPAPVWPAPAGDVTTGTSEIYVYV